MEWWQAIILGIIEGLTEYLPVSSTGHLILAQRAMGIENSDAAGAYAICIQAGAILAVIGLYRNRVEQMAKGVLGKDVDGRRLLINLVAGFLPAAVLGVLLNDLIKSYLFGLWPTVGAWVVGGVLILVVGAYQKRKGGSDSSKGLAVDQITWKIAMFIGFAQCVAMWPGTSRSLMTIVGGVAAGLSIAAAVEFSFLLGLITLGAATCYDALKHGDEMLEMYGVMEIAIGLVFAMLSAVIAIKWMVAYLKSHGLAVFGYYRIALGAVVGVLILMDVLG